jgi:hypothetical protein
MCSKRFTQRNHANHSDARARYAVLKERAETQLSRGGMDTWLRSAKWARRRDAHALPQE